MPTLVLIRHGQSQWNLENKFTGWVDVPLTEQGREEATQRIETAGGTPWEIAGRNDAGGGDFRNAVRQLLVAAKQVRDSGNEEQGERMVEILRRARKDIYTMLAED